MKRLLQILIIALFVFSQAHAGPPVVPPGQVLIEAPTTYNLVKIFDEEINDENGLIRGVEITSYNKDGVPKRIVNGQEVATYVRVMLYNCTTKVYFWVSLELRNAKNEIIEETPILSQITPILPHAEKEVSTACEKPPKVPFKRSPQGKHSLDA